MNQSDSHLFSGFCDSLFWDPDRTWNTTTPQLSPCMIDTVLTYSPAALLWLIFPYQLYDYFTSGRAPIRPNALNRTKLCLAITYAAISLIQLCLVLFKSSVSGAELTSGIVNFLSAGLFLFGVHCQRVYGFINGGLVFFYILFQIFTSVLSLPTVIHDDHYLTSGQRWAWIIKFGVKVLLLVALSFADRVDQNKELLKAESSTGSEVCTKDTSSIPSKLTFWWYNSLMILGYKKTLTISDMWKVRSADCAETVFKTFNKFWAHRSFVDDDESKKTESNGSSIKKAESNGSSFRRSLQSFKEYGSMNRTRESSSSKVNVFSVLWHAHRVFFIFPSLGRFFTDILLLANPIIMKFMILFAMDSEAPAWQGFAYATFFVGTNTLATFMTSYQQHRMSVLALRIRNSLISAIYHKSLVLASGARKRFTSGEIVNMMAVDSQRFIDLLPWICFLWTAPVQIVIALWLLWAELGPSVLGGLAIMMLTIPANLYVGKRTKNIQQAQMKVKDSRLKMVTELLNGIKVLKLYAWEPAFVKNIENIRTKELGLIKESAYITTIFNLISVSSPFFTSFATFAIYVYSNDENILTPEKAFVSIALFNLLRVPLKMIPNMISGIVLVLVSMKRINRFLNAEEVEKYVNKDYDKANAVKVEKASFAWDAEEQDTEEDNETLKTIPRPILTDISMSIPKGSLTAIIGSVGSGKSSLISALLGEMQKLTGSVSLSGEQKIGYVAQQAWIQNATVKQNVLFSSEYRFSDYQSVLEACALGPDLKSLTDGDQTEIGEKGINLSGGQKQRIAIARACYQNSDLYLFDDPLSAVDSHVGKHIFENVLSTESGILRHKTRVLVTNALFMLPRVDQIIMLKNGQVEATGSYKDLLENCPSFSKLIASYSSNSSNSDSDSDELPEMKRKSKPEVTIKIRRNRTISTVSTQSEKAKSKELLTNRPARKLVEDEAMSEGKVSLEVYRKFLSALSWRWSVIILISYLMINVANISSNSWVASWTDDAGTSGHTLLYYLSIYLATGLVEAFFVCFGWYAVVNGTMRASTNLHSQLLNSIVRAPMAFFDVTLLGRIVNRFSKDIDVLDNYMAFTVRVLMNTTFQVICTLFLISFKLPIFLLVAVPFACLYFFLQRFYVSTTRQLKRLESVSRSPIFTHFSETNSGVSTIKAFRATSRFIGQMNSKIDENQRCFYPTLVANGWLQVRLELAANLLVFFAAMFATLSRNWENKLSGADTGLSLSYALNVSIALNFCVRMFADLENNVVSVERVSEYIAVKPEADWETEEDKKLVKNWPEGKIDFERYEARYRPGLELVLKGVDLDVNSGAKIGIVGRTGSGKSTMTLGLFRIIEAANGRILIDGVDISKLGLQTLRSRLTILPQDCLLYSGTIRTNLDPFGTYTDTELWTALENSHLKSFVTSHEEGLEYAISEGGDNLSVGQRQLICLARALLRKKKILVLDEATSGVDLETDCLVQSTIRKEFADCTILTIAHRLNTIMDSDKVLVMDGGRVAEFDKPEVLLSDERSIFYSLARDAGLV